MPFSTMSNGQKIAFGLLGLGIAVSFVMALVVISANPNAATQERNTINGGLVMASCLLSAVAAWLFYNDDLNTQINNLQTRLDALKTPTLNPPINQPVIQNNREAIFAADLERQKANLLERRPARQVNQIDNANLQQPDNTEEIDNNPLNGKRLEMIRLNRNIEELDDVRPPMTLVRRATAPI